MPVRSYRKIVGIGSTVYAAVVLALVALVVVPVAPRVIGTTPTDRVLAAATGLAAAQEVHLTGAFAAGDLRLDDRTAADGSGLGTIVTSDGAHATLLTISGTSYVRGDRAWWLSRSAPDTGIYSGHWMTEGSLGFTPTDVLTPKKLAAAIRKGLKKDPLVGDNSRAHRATVVTDGRPTMLHGLAVQATTVPSGLTVYVTTDTPYRVVALDGTLTAFGPDVATGRDGETFALDVAVGDKGDRGKLAGDVRTAAKGLDADKDPAEPAEYTWDHATAAQVGCDVNGCGEKVTVTNDGTGAPKGQAYLLGEFVAAQPAGFVLGSCKVAIPALRPGASAAVTCHLSGLRWTAWVLSGAGGYRVRMLTFNPGWDGNDPTPLQKVMALALPASVTSVSASPTEAAQALVMLVGTKGWSAQDAVNAEEGLTTDGEIGDVLDLLKTGHFVADQGNLLGTNPYVLVEALRRIKAGSAKVAIGNWTGPDGNAYYCDVFDLGAHQAVELGYVTKPTVRDSVGQIVQEAGRFGTNTPPPGFSKQLRLRVDPTNPLYRLTHDQARAELRRRGLTANKLNGTTVVLVAGHGDITLPPADFR